MSGCFLFLLEIYSRMITSWITMFSVYTRRRVADVARYFEGSEVSLDKAADDFLRSAGRTYSTHGVQVYTMFRARHGVTDDDLMARIGVETLTSHEVHSILDVLGTEGVIFSNVVFRDTAVLLLGYAKIDGHMKAICLRRKPPIEKGKKKPAKIYVFAKDLNKWKKGSPLVLTRICRR